MWDLNSPLKFEMAHSTQHQVANPTLKINLSKSPYASTSTSISTSMFVYMSLPRSLRYFRVDVPKKTPSYCLSGVQVSNHVVCANDFGRVS